MVLGVGLGAIPACLPARSSRATPRWRRMVRDVKTVATQAFQVWLDQDIDELGWKRPHVHRLRLRRALRHVGATWPTPSPRKAGRSPPRRSLYFCGVLPDPAAAGADDDRGLPAPAARRRCARTRSRFLRETCARSVAGAVRRRRRVPLGDAGDATRADRRRGRPARRASTRQYWPRTSIRRTATCSRCPGSSKYRISPLDMTYDNLTIAGDWTERLEPGLRRVGGDVRSAGGARARRHARLWRTSSATTIPEMHDGRSRPTSNGTPHGATSDRRSGDGRNVELAPRAVDPPRPTGSRPAVRSRAAGAATTRASSRRPSTPAYRVVEDNMREGRQAAERYATAETHARIPRRPDPGTIAAAWCT